MEQTKQISMAESKAALDILDSAFMFFSQNKSFSEDLKIAIEKYLPVYQFIPEGMIMPHVYPFADVDVMNNSITDLVNTGLFHYVIYKNLLNEYFGGKRK